MAGTPRLSQVPREHAVCPRRVTTMRPPFVRFRIREIMIAVGIVAVVLGLGATVQRRKERYPLLAAYHQGQREIWAREAWPTAEHVCIYPNVRSEQQEMLEDHVSRYGPKAGLALDRALQHHNLSEAYKRASDLSWLDVLFDNVLP
jgi:hypothetical protein